MRKRQTNLFEFLGDLEEAVRQEYNKAMHDDQEDAQSYGQATETTVPTLGSLVEAQLRKALTESDTDRIQVLYAIYKDLHD